ncbi:MAG TPA: flagellar M-ring protein FliF C-terminal domain-containing protein [Candidatus Baltobacteraceae bacterium]|nr:flagellar M-ring protein FliF C-terminal domain-containing protein [Candidatus Baltobacteraceae bacterium]
MTHLFAPFLALPRRSQVLAAAVAFVFIALVVAVSIAARPQRVPLFAAPLKPEQVAEVQERLAGWNVAFTPLADNVVVDAPARNALLLRLSLAGVPHAHLETSQDVLSKLGALTPQSVIDAQTRDALAADIASALRGIAGVQDAQVIIAPAKPAFFADDAAHDATASVRLQLAAGVRLSQDSIDGIRTFVAAAVQGLAPQSVTIVDDRGVALDRGPAGDDGGLQISLQSALDAAFGAGTSIVRVRVEYDRRSITSKDVRRAPFSRLAIDGSTQTERFSGAGKHYEQSSSQIDRGSDTRESSASVDGPRVARISAAVVMDAARIGDLAPVRSLASATLGMNAARGDVLDVEAVPFSHLPAQKKDGWWLAYGALVPVLPTIVAAGAGLLALRMCGAPLLGFARTAIRRLGTVQQATAPGVSAQAVRGALAGEPAHAAAAVISALPAATAAAVLAMYPEHERTAIVKRMQRTPSPLVPGIEEILARG